MSIKGFYINGSVQKYDYKSLDNIDGGTGLTEQAKRALLACFEQVAWIGQDGQSYYDALEEALYPQGYVEVTNNLTGCRSTNEAVTAAVGKPYNATIIADSGYSLTGAEVSITMGGTSVTGYYSNGTISIPNVTGDIVITVTAVSSISSISAVFTQGSATIYDTDSLDTLRQYLTVTAYYADTTSATVNDYELSGTLTAGTSTITASYGGKTTTFAVMVTAVLYNLENQTITSSDTGDYFVTDINACQADFACTIFLDVTTTSNTTSGNVNTVPKFLFQFNTGIGRCLAVGKQDATDNVLRLWWMSTAATDYYTLTGLSPAAGRFRFAVTHEANSDLVTLKYRKDSGEVVTVEATRTFATATTTFSFGTTGNHGFPPGTIHLARICEGVASADRINDFFA